MDIDNDLVNSPTWLAFNNVISKSINKWRKIYNETKKQTSSKADQKVINLLSMYNTENRFNNCYHIEQINIYNLYVIYFCIF